MLKLKQVLALFRPVKDPSAAELEHQRADLERARRGILNHAYGFVSRGNRAAGIRHIHEYLESESWDTAAGLWFFYAMTKWERPDAALAFGRDLIGQLLRAGLAPEAHKVLLQCQHLDGNFLARPEDQIPLTAVPPESTQP